MFCLQFLPNPSISNIDNDLFDYNIDK
jgi:4-hydroxybenzoate polyprenyltransferase